MTAEKKDRRPLRIKNLADLKRHIKLGTELVATAHQYHPDIVGLTRVVTKVLLNSSTHLLACHAVSRLIIAQNISSITRLGSIIPHQVS